MSVASSEEITAALEVAIKSCEWAGYEYPAEEEKQNAAAVTLRAHLSRLREEAEFVEACRASYAAWERKEFTAACHLWEDGRTAYRAVVAARALEEPRDG